MIPNPDVATLLRSGLDLCRRPAAVAVPGRKATKTLAAIEAVPPRPACSHERRRHDPCTEIVQAATKTTPAVICGCPKFVEA